MDASQTITSATNYTPYGQVLEQYLPGVTHLGFTGEQTDASGLQYLRARYYDPNTAMFLSRDPVLGFVGGQSIRWNPYIYAGANPVNYVDPTGECFFAGVDTLACLGFAAAAVVAAVGAVTYYQNMPEEYQLHSLAGYAYRSAESAVADAGNLIEEILRPLVHPPTLLALHPEFFPAQPPAQMETLSFPVTSMERLIEQLIPPYLPPVGESFPAGDPLTLRDFILMSTSDDSGGGTSGAKWRDFAHSTSLESINDIIENGLNDSAARSVSKGGSVNRPGSFFTVEVTPQSFSVIASDLISFGMRHSEMPILMVMTIPHELFGNFERAGKVETRVWGELIETVFSPDTFPAINQGLKDGTITITVIDTFKDQR